MATSCPQRHLAGAQDVPALSLTSILRTASSMAADVAAISLSTMAPSSSCRTSRLLGFSSLGDKSQTDQFHPIKLQGPRERPGTGGCAVPVLGQAGSKHEYPFSPTQRVYREIKGPSPTPSPCSPGPAEGCPVGGSAPGQAVHLTEPAGPATAA
jgi:hypothetical protein